MNAQTMTEAQLDIASTHKEERLGVCVCGRLNIIACRQSLQETYHSLPKCFNESVNILH